MSAEGRPQTEDHPPSLEEANFVVGLLGCAPPQHLIEAPGPRQVGYTQGYEADALFHLQSIARRLPRSPYRCTAPCRAGGSALFPKPRQVDDPRAPGLTKGLFLSSLPRSRRLCPPSNPTSGRKRQNQRLIGPPNMSSAAPTTVATTAIKITREVSVRGKTGTCSNSMSRPSPSPWLPF
jgi:hypothetical protein